MFSKKLIILTNNLCLGITIPCILDEILVFKKSSITRVYTVTHTKSLIFNDVF